MKVPVRVFLILVCWGALAAAQSCPPQPYIVEMGGVQLKPGGFFELIGLTRSATTPETISTHFGMDRALWTGQSGVMTYAMCRFRYTFN